MRCTPKLLWTGPCRHTTTRQHVWKAAQRCEGRTETSPAFSLFVASSNGLAICPEPNHPKWPMGGAPSGCSVPMGGASSEWSAARFENSASSSSPLRPSSCCRSDSAVATASCLHCCADFLTDTAVA